MSRQRNEKVHRIISCECTVDVICHLLATLFAFFFEKIKWKKKTLLDVKVRRLRPKTERDEKKTINSISIRFVWFLSTRVSVSHCNRCNLSTQLSNGDECETEKIEIFRRDWKCNWFWSLMHTKFEIYIFCAMNVTLKLPNDRKQKETNCYAALRFVSFDRIDFNLVAVAESAIWLPISAWDANGETNDINIGDDDDSFWCDDAFTFWFFCFSVRIQLCIDACRGTLNVI